MIKKRKLAIYSPSRMTLVSFALLILVGTGLLMIPDATVKGGLDLVDALFMSTSAVCVTGLSVLDTGKDLTIFGQLVILVLIQAGGLGIMTISTLFLLAVGKRPGMTGRTIIEDTFTNSGEKSISEILREVLLIAFTIEGIGVILFSICFFRDHSLGETIHFSIFHSISAFCNAGFSLFSDSFERYRSDWFLNGVTSALIILGGIGFLVIMELRTKFLRNHRRLSRLSLHTKLVLSATVILLFAGTLTILVMEWNNTLKTLSLPGKLLAAFFQSVTSRTAGFNTLPIGGMANETLFFMILLMFIGASPGSCGGGIKTTTFITLFHTGFCKLRGLERPQVFHRTIPRSSVERATSIVLIAALIVILGTLSLLMSELGQIPHVMARGKFLEIFFEVVSAFGTVGLSTGITSDFSNFGKLVLTVIMFIGRVGPLVAALAVSRTSYSRFYFAEETIMIG